MKAHRLIFIIVIATMGAVSFVNNSGYAAVIKSNDITSYLLLGIMLLCAMFSVSGKSRQKKKTILFWFAAVVIYWCRSSLAGYNMDGFRFLTYFVCIFVVSKLCFDEKNMNYLCLIYGGLTSVILFFCNFGSLLKGWNPNSLAIQAFQMLMIFCIGFNTDFKRITIEKGELNARFRMLIFWVLVLYAMSMMEILDCRSATLSCIVSAVLMLKSESLIGILENKKMLLILILVPCIIAFLIVFISDKPFVDGLNEWSYRQFKKPIFNGRDKIWEKGIQWFYESPIYGKGNLNYGNWHNSAVACLSAFGIVGYFIYVTVFYNVLSKAAEYMNDVFVRKATIVFLIANFQQSFENTICQSKLMILHPYLILGIILGRIAYLEYENKCKYNNTGIQYR